MTYPNAIFGDNQFLGVNHANQKKAYDLHDKFQDTDEILKVLNSAYECGVRDFMFTTHDRYNLVFEEIARSNLFNEMYYTPCIPYAHKYWGILSEKGMVGMLTSTISKVKKRNLFGLLALLKGDTKGITSLLTEMEIFMCKGLAIRGVFLQNLAFDLLMACELYSIIEDFSYSIERKFNCHAGFITMNHSRAVKVLCDKLQLDQPWICANYNKTGFRMNPTQHDCNLSFASKKSHNIAMSVFASGNINPTDALEFVVSQMDDGGVDSILFGSSNPRNIEKNFKTINNKYT